MNRPVALVSDSALDLGDELSARYGVRFVPLRITVGGASYRDGAELTPDQLFALCRRTGELPKTSAPNPADYAAVFREAVDAGCAVVCFCLSGELSSSYRNARLAAGEFEDVYVVDTRSLSTGGGLLLAAAGDMASDGCSAAEIADTCRELCDHADVTFVLSDLEYLRRGGRCSALAALGANLMQLKPAITVRGGTMRVGKKYRGRFSGVLQQYADDRLRDLADVDTRRAFVAYADCDMAIVERIREQVRALGVFGEVPLVRAGCTISSHCGRGTFLISYLRKHAVSGER